MSMDKEARDKVIGHALDHVAYRFSSGLPVRHDRRDWTEEEIALYKETYSKASKQAYEQRRSNQ